MKEMLRALRPFFEILVYTSKAKDEAEAIVNALENGESFFSYIVPLNYCYNFPEEKISIKDIEIFFGNRLPSEFVMISTSPFDLILCQQNGIPIFPFLEDHSDLALNLLEQYILKLKWVTDVREIIKADFAFSLC
jgi:TFIIF-interacting CTD phosphatase-like protein